MAKFFVVCLTLVAFFAFPAVALADRETSDDPNNRGYYEDMGHNYKIDWKPYVTNCDPCKSQVADYNSLMQTIFDLRWQRKEIDVMQERVEKYGKMIRDATEENTENNTRYGKGVSGRMEEGLASILNSKEAADQMKAQIPALEAQIKNLETMAAGLRGQITECEKQCRNPEDSKKTGFVGGGGGGVAAIALPFDWRGPYPEVCHKCAKLAARLNELPALARGAIARIENAKAQKALAELKIMQARGEDSMVSQGGASNRTEEISKNFDRRQNARNQETIKENEDAIKKAQEDIAANEADLDEIEHNFKYTLKLYDECVPTCQTTEDKRTGCFYIPGTNTVMTIGANSQFGSGAEIKSKVKEMVGGGLGSLMGGGVNLGGMGGGMQRIDDPIGSPMGSNSAGKGPKTVKDSTTGDFANISAGGGTVGFRANLTGDGLLVSSKIDETPGDGTFHAQWLEDANGRTYLPKRYYIYATFYDWKLTVWWSETHWVDGEVVYHDEGEEISAGTELVDFGAIRLFDDAEGYKNSIWYQNGFDTAVKGIKGLGALYDIPEEVLAGPCPLRLVTHVSQPKNDPVDTIPFLADIPMLGNAFSDERQKQKRDLILQVTPALVKGTED